MMKTQKQVNVTQHPCNKFSKCSCSVCPLDTTAGCYVPGDKICSHIKDYWEGKDFPLKNLVKENQDSWQVELSPRLLNKQIRSRQKLRVYWKGKTSPKTNKTRVLKEISPISNVISSTNNFI